MHYGMNQFNDSRLVLHNIMKQAKIKMKNENKNSSHIFQSAIGTQIC